MTILGISVGTSRTGVCVLNENGILDRHIHDYPTVWSDNKLRIILNRYRRYILKYRITDIVLKLPPEDRRSSAVLRLIRRIEALAKEYNCTYDFTTKFELKTKYSLHSTKEIIACTKHFYPELLVLEDNKNDASHSYNAKLYEAILSAHAYQERQRVRTLQQAHTTE